jgi:hypothetical protein
MSPTVLTIREADITSELCRRCAACCQISIQVPNLDARFRRFLRGVGFEVSPPPKEESEDCCDGTHASTVHLGPCRHLIRRDGEAGATHECAAYDDPRRPQLCADFNCVSWAKANNTYNLDNVLLVRAQAAWNVLRVGLP